MIEAQAIPSELVRAVIGKAEVWAVEEIAHKKPLSAMTTNESLIAALPSWMFPTFIDVDGMFDIVTRSWILIVDDRIGVIDPCTGNGRSFPDFPPAHMLDTPYIERFAATGIRPEDVDFVFCTHLHMDHCGWNTMLRDGKYVPTFPNAQYFMARQEVDRWNPSHPGYIHVPQNAGTFENSILPVLEAGLGRIIEGNHRICPSIEVEPSFGHTAGHSTLHLKSGGRGAYFVGDVFHHPLELLHPELDDRTSEDFPALLASRRKIISTCLRENALVVPAHLRCPFGGYLQNGAAGLLFEPYQPAPAGS